MIHLGRSVLNILEIFTFHWVLDHLPPYLKSPKIRNPVCYNHRIQFLLKFWRRILNFIIFNELLSSFIYYTWNKKVFEGWLMWLIGCWLMWLIGPINLIISNKWTTYEHSLDNLTHNPLLRIWNMSLHRSKCYGEFVEVLSPGLQSFKLFNPLSARSLIG